jgi:hypothetical protein
MTTTAQSTFSPLMLCDSLLSLAKEADHAGLRATANRLLNLATSVLDEAPVGWTHTASRARNRLASINPVAAKQELRSG